MYTIDVVPPLPPRTHPIHLRNRKTSHEDWGDGDSGICEDFVDIQVMLAASRKERMAFDGIFPSTSSYCEESFSKVCISPNSYTSNPSKQTDSSQREQERRRDDSQKTPAVSPEETVRLPVRVRSASDRTACDQITLKGKRWLRSFRRVMFSCVCCSAKTDCCTVEYTDL